MGAKKKSAKSASPYTIKQRKDGRFMVAKRGGGYINADEKVKILGEAGKIKVMKSKPKEAPAEEAAPEAPAADAAATEEATK